MGRKKRRAPVTLEIANLSHEGRGVGRVDGKTVFVGGALPGEKVVARIVRRRASFDEALVERFALQRAHPLIASTGGSAVTALSWSVRRGGIELGSGPNICRGSPTGKTASSAKWGLAPSRGERNPR